MTTIFTCIVCPNGCDIEAVVDGRELTALEGAQCARGREYVERELRDPQRTIASSVLVEDGEAPLVSVRLSGPIPKGRIFDVMREIRGLRVSAPIASGDALARNVLDLGCDVVATCHVPRRDARAAAKRGGCAG